jgi:diguanylate cyclase (GGDEF)-like protein
MGVMESASPLQTVLQDSHFALLAIVLAFCTSVVAFTLFSHVLARGARSHAWLLVNGFCAGVGLWSASLIMTLAGSARPEGFVPGFAVMALIATVALATGGLSLASRAGRPAIAGGGAIVGAGLVIAHLADMTAFHRETLFWDGGLIAVAAVLTMALFSGAFALFRELSGTRGFSIAAGLMTLGALLLFAVLSWAATIATHLAPAITPLPLTETAMAAVTALAAAVVLIAGAVAAELDGRAIRANFSRLGELIDGIPDGVVIANDGKIIGVNLGLVELSGLKERELIGKDVFGELLDTWKREGAPGRAVAFETSMLTTFAAETIPVRVVRQTLHALGRANEIYTIRDLRERDEAKVTIADLTAHLNRVEADLRQRNFLLGVVLKNMTQGMAMYSRDQRILLANERYAGIYGQPPEVVAPGAKLRDIVQKRIDAGLFACGSGKAYLEAALAPVDEPAELVHELSDGRFIAISQRPMPGGGWVTTHDDITHLRRIEAENLHLTQDDPLTLLPNRTALRAALSETLAAAGHHRRRLGLLMINLDHFREVNDTMGHPAGDALLGAVAERLRSFVRRNTLLGRFGDDEFVLVEAVERPGRDAAALAGRIQEQMRQPFIVNGKVVRITATIGIAISPGDGQEADLLLKRADLALYRAKRQERGSYLFFEPSMERQLAEQLSLEADISEALAKGQFELHFQPLVNLAKKEIAGFETLLRWNHPTRGKVAPADFIPAAEAAGMMPAIGEWALRRACEEAAQWPEPLKVSLNVSKSQFKSPDFAQSVISAVAAAGLTTQRLEIEIPEAVILEDREEALAITRRLADLGVGIALDDFGTAFSSVSFLGEFPFRRMKIDRSFIRGVTGLADSQVMVRTLLRLGTSFGAAITAEGVETQEQYDFVLGEGFTEMQGYYFSPPKTAEEISRLFLTQKDSAVA